MSPVPPARILRRLALAAALVVAIGLTRGLDVAVIVALSLAVMEVEPYVR
jgi:hypothetical protein